MNALLVLLLAAPQSCARQKNPLLAAQCERKQGHFVEALQRLEKVKSKKADKLRAELQAHVTTYEVFTEPEGAAVTVDGAPRSPPLVVNPGRHVFHAELDGHRPVEREETALEGTHPKLTLVLEKLAPPLEAAPVVEDPKPAESTVVVGQQPAAPPPAPVKREPSVLPYVLGGAGLVSLLAGGTFLFTSELQHVEGGRRTGSYVLLGTGAALCLAAIVWLLVERRPGAP